ncbi:restriction endonuclease subunit S [Teichococcus coralli]|nr:restriction endonuclease subunit S [Pseudoroseomonas coralli]
MDFADIQHVQPPPGSEGTRTKVQPGDILVTITADLGRIGLVADDVPEAYVNQHVALARPANRDFAPYLAWFLTAPAAQAQLGLLDRGATRSGLGLADIGAVRVSLPPLAEQRRIVARIEALFGAIRDARKDLDRTLVLAERFRNALVAAAISGELASDRSGSGMSAEESGVFMDRLASERRQLWEQSELARAAAKGRRLKDNWKDRFPSPVKPVEHYADSLPAGWTLASLDQLAWAASYGTSEKCDPAGSGSPVLRIPNVARGAIDLSDLKFATGDLGLVPGEAVAPGDLLVVRTNGSPDLVGRGAVVRQSLERDVYFASYLIRFRLVGNDTLWRWIALVWHSPMIRDQVFAKAASSAGQYNVSMTELASFALPIPPEAEQARLVNLVEERLKVTDEMERQARASHDLLSRLERQILDVAFRGDLVPQDAADEPAEETLARLRQEAEAPAGPRGRQRRRAA